MAVAAVEGIPISCCWKATTFRSATVPLAYWRYRLSASSTKSSGNAFLNSANSTSTAVSTARSVLYTSLFVRLTSVSATLTISRARPMDASPVLRVKQLTSTPACSSSSRRRSNTCLATSPYAAKGTSGTSSASAISNELSGSSAPPSAITTSTCRTIATRLNGYSPLMSTSQGSQQGAYPAVLRTLVRPGFLGLLNCHRIPRPLARVLHLDESRPQNSQRSQRDQRDAHRRKVTGFGDHSRQAHSPVPDTSREMRRNAAGTIL